MEIRSFFAYSVHATVTKREKAIDQTINLMRTPETVVFSDASEKKEKLGAATVILDRHNTVQKSWQASSGSKAHRSIHAAGLIAIYYAMVML